MAIYTSYICSSCGSLDKPVTHTPGSMVIEIILWMCIIIPGLIYSVWRHSAKKKMCKHCENLTLLPATSPAGLKLVAQHGYTDAQVVSAGIYTGPSIVTILIGLIFVFLVVPTIGIIAFHKTPKAEEPVVPALTVQPVKPKPAPVVAPAPVAVDVPAAQAVEAIQTIPASRQVQIDSDVPSQFDSCIKKGQAHYKKEGVAAKNVETLLILTRQSNSRF